MPRFRDTKMSVTEQRCVLELGVPFLTLNPKLVSGSTEGTGDVFVDALVHTNSVNKHLNVYAMLRGNKGEATQSLTECPDRQAQTHQKWWLQWRRCVPCAYKGQSLPTSAWWNQGKLDGESLTWGHTRQMGRHVSAGLVWRHVVWQWNCRKEYAVEL